VEDSARTFIDMQVSAETRRAYEQDLRRWFRFIEDVGDITYDTVVAFRDHLQETLAPASAGRCFSTIRTYHRWLVQLGKAERNLFEAVKGPKRIKNQTPKVPANDDVDALVAAARERPVWLAVVELLLNGLRAKEVGQLLKSDIRWDEDHQRYFMRVIGKGQKERLVPLTDEASAALRDFWSDAGYDRSVYAVHDSVGQPYSNKAVGHIVYDAAGKVKLKGMHPHALRHHFATRLAKNGVDVMALRDLLGHESVQTTEGYITLDLTDKFKAMEKDPRRVTEVQLRAVS
jgi:site-specific recombinase XerD